MANTKKAETRLVVPTTNSNQKDLVPDYIAQSGPDSSIKALADYIIIPRVYIVQKQSDDEIREVVERKEGTICLRPNNVIIPEGTKFVPIFFFPSWAKVNDIRLRGAEPTILEYTLDKDSECAKKARFASTRVEPHPQYADRVVKYVGSLNFVITLLDFEDYTGTAVLSFRNAEFKTGMAFCSQLKGFNNPIYARKWQFGTTRRKNNKGDWHAIVPVVPQYDESDSLYVSQEDFLALKNMSEGIKSEHEKQGIAAISDEDAQDDTTEIIGEGSETKF